MTYYYLDIETTGFDEENDKIITIQYVELDEKTAKPVGPLKILKEWESDEKTILKRFIEDFRPEYKWAFVPIGYGLSFEHKFFWQRCISNGLKPIGILTRPFLDLMTVGVLLNGGSFKGAALNDLTSKSQDGSVIPGYYKEKKYAEIGRYIKNEIDGFCGLATKLYVKLPKLRDELLREN